MKKGEKNLKMCYFECVETIWFGWIGRSTWKMTLTDDLCEVQKIRGWKYLGMNSKCCKDRSELS